MDNQARAWGSGFVEREVLRAFKSALDPTTAQSDVLAQRAGAARWALSYAFVVKASAHQRWRAEVTELAAQGVEEAEARRRMKGSVPSKPQIQKQLNEVKGDSGRMAGCRRGVRAGAAVSVVARGEHVRVPVGVRGHGPGVEELAGLVARCAGGAEGRLTAVQEEGPARVSFRLHHHVKRPGIRLKTYRRLRLPTIGEVRLHDSGKRLGRLVDRGQAIVQSVTVSRAGHRWDASVLCKVTMTIPERHPRACRDL
ncbi:hypothetical protein GTW69_01205 [Streptomyces sp. SID7760]|nr:hypothetical protein [Streptomyces sp. SID7760]